ncbi:MAG: dipeptidase [Candidatus Latescibacteria bacterium]|nr:dipeptidase [Candidatus Latescibacterota bacterium]
MARNQEDSEPSTEDLLLDRAMSIHRTGIVMNAAVMSSQALIKPGRDIGKRWQGLDLGTGDLDLPRLRDGGVNVLWQAVCGSTGEDEEKIPLQGLELIDSLLTDIVDRYPDDFELALTVSDVRRIHEQGKITVLLGMQAGQFLGGSVRALRVYRRLGVRYMTLTHAWTNLLCDSASGDIRWNGLSEVGREVVREMGILGVIPDISHATDQAALQVLELSRGPVIATHSNARALCCPPAELACAMGADSLEERNLSDDLIRRLADKGGVACVNFAPALVSQKFSEGYPKLRKLRPELNAHMEAARATHPDDVEAQREEKDRFIREQGITPATLDDVADHIEYLADVGGWDHVGIGTDWEGTGGHHPRHLEDVSKIPLLTAELLRRGHGESEIRKVLGENMLKVLEETQEVEMKQDAS